MEKPVKFVILAFSSGKFVITGLKSESEIDQVIVAFGKEIREKELFSQPIL
jgi:TATA-box binding protein (TBP) (component of TFIID and TFIIIB)